MGLTASASAICARRDVVRRFVPGGLLAAVASATIAAVAAVSLVAAKPASAGMQPAWNVDTHRLIRELAVLRGPQRAGDLDASLLHAANIRVRWVETLMRRVQVAGRDVYLVPAQSTVLGSGLAVFSTWGMTCCVSAEALTEGGAFVNQGPPLWMLGVVPDGVAKVAIKAHGRTFTARMTDNTVDVRSRLMNDAQEMTWYEPHGAVLKRLRASSKDVRARGFDRDTPTIDLRSENIVGPTTAHLRSSLGRASVPARSPAEPPRWSCCSGSPGARSSSAAPVSVPSP